MDRRQLGSIPSIPTTVTVCLVLVILTLQSFIPGIGAARTFTFANGCSSDVWVGTQPNGGIPILAEGGFALAAGETMSLVAEEGWGGRFWGRTGCTFNADGIGSCETGDCGGLLRCAGAGGDPPASLAEFTLNGANGDDFYDVSLVDGYNMEIRIIPTGGNGTCGSPGCTSNLNPQCPEALQVLSGGTVVACKSACAAFGSPQYCCTDAYGSPATCPPTTYSKVFKSACPTAYSYAYDDASSTFTCTGADYKISFCTSGSPSSSGGGGGSQSPPPPGTGILSPPSSLAAEKLVQSLITHMLNSLICATAIISLLIQLNGLWRDSRLLANGNGREAPYTIAKIYQAKITLPFMQGGQAYIHPNPKSLHLEKLTKGLAHTPTIQLWDLTSQHILGQSNSCKISIKYQKVV